ncbi:MAG: fibronectin type III domain-containing protein [Sphingobacteriales bacterium]|nr:MAG: fibronectin type III domain-containing protein [Sphingobacteriales bacterium]
MNLLRISVAFVYYADSLLITFVQALLAALTGNPNFATPSPTLAAITTLLNNFETAYANAAGGGKTLTAIKNQERASLIEGLRLLASYVEDNSANNEAIMLSSGFDIYGGPLNPRPLPEIPQNLRLSDGPLSGSVIAKVNKVEFAVVYELRYTEDDFGPDARWVQLSASTSTNMLISGLTPSKNIWVQVRSVNSKGYSEWSDPATIMVR